MRTRHSRRSSRFIDVPSSPSPINYVSDSQPEEVEDQQNGELTPAASQQDDRLPSPASQRDDRFASPASQQDDRLPPAASQEDDVPRTPDWPGWDADWENFTGATPQFQSQRLLMEWLKGRRLRRLEEEEAANNTRVIVINSSPLGSLVIRAKEADQRDLAGTSDGGLLLDGKQQQGKAEGKKEVIVIGSSPPGSPVIRAGGGSQSGLISIEESVEVVGGRKAAGKAKEVDRQRMAVPKRKRDMGRDAEGTDADVPQKKKRATEVLNMRVQTKACSVTVVIEADTGSAGRG